MIPVYYAYNWFWLKWPCRTCRQFYLQDKTYGRSLDQWRYGAKTRLHKAGWLYI